MYLFTLTGWFACCICVFGNFLEYAGWSFCEIGVCAFAVGKGACMLHVDGLCVEFFVGFARVSRSFTWACGDA